MTRRCPSRPRYCRCQDPRRRRRPSSRTSPVRLAGRPGSAGALVPRTRGPSAGAWSSQPVPRRRPAPGGDDGRACETTRLHPCPFCRPCRDQVVRALGYIRSRARKWQITACASTPAVLDQTRGVPPPRSARRVGSRPDKSGRVPPLLSQRPHAARSLSARFVPFHCPGMTARRGPVSTQKGCRCATPSTRLAPGTPALMPSGSSAAPP